MKTSTIWFFIIVLSICSTQSFAQGWVPVGTQWTYSEHNYINDSNIPSKIIAESEIIDDGRLVTKLVVNPASGCTFQPEVIYAYTTPEKEVYFKFPEDTSYVKYYDFSIQAGEHFSIPMTINGIDEEMTVYIDGVDTIQVFDEIRIRVRGHILMRWIVFVAPPSFVWIEGMGDVMNSMFLAHSIYCDATNSSVFGFICHDHPELGVYKPDHISDCDSIFTSHLSENEFNSSLTAYPNPAKDQLFFESEEFDSWTADFVHPSGKLIHSAQINLNKLSIPDFMHPGIYLVILKDKRGNQKHLKILKE